MASTMCSPGTNSAQTCRSNSGYITRNVPHGGRRIVSVWPQVDSGQALQQLYGATLGHASVAIDHHVFVQPLCVRLVAEQGQRNPRVESNVFDLLLLRQVANHELFVFNSDPHYGDLRPAACSECSQVRKRCLRQQLAYRLWNVHVFLPLLETIRRPLAGCSHLIGSESRDHKMQTNHV